MIGLRRQGMLELALVFIVGVIAGITAAGWQSRTRHTDFDGGFGHDHPPAKIRIMSSYIEKETEQ